jgi:hypothetical protein
LDNIKSYVIRTKFDKNYYFLSGEITGDRGIVELEDNNREFLWSLVSCIFKYSNKTTNQMQTQLKNILLFSRVNAAQHVSGNILPIIKSTFKLQSQPPVSV